jgi:hypothetical protein
MLLGVSQHVVDWMRPAIVASLVVIVAWSLRSSPLTVRLASRPPRRLFRT